MGQGSTETAMDLVDPRAPRFGQSITATGLLLGVLLREPVLVYLITIILVASILSRWKLDLYIFLWRRVVTGIITPATEREPAAPHRFAKILGGFGSLLASLLLLMDFILFGFAIALIVGLLAGLAATTGYCLGCRLYQQIGFLRRHDVV